MSGEQRTSEDRPALTGDRDVPPSLITAVQAVIREAQYHGSSHTWSLPGTVLAALVEETRGRRSEAASPELTQRNAEDVFRNGWEAGHAAAMMSCTCTDPTPCSADARPNDSVMWEAIERAFLSAVHEERPCPFCMARTGNVWPYCVHLAPCVLHDWSEKLNAKLAYEQRRERDPLAAASVEADKIREELGVAELEREAARKASAEPARGPCTPGAVPRTCSWYDEDYDDATDPAPMPASCTEPATHWSCNYDLTPCLNVCEKHRCRCKQPSKTSPIASRRGDAIGDRAHAQAGAPATRRDRHA